MRTLELKIKIKSLAAEAQIIRKEERKLKGRGFRHSNEKNYPLFYTIEHHRKCDVREEARISLLAYGYLRGRPYKSIEVKTRKSLWYMRSKIAEMATRFGDGKVTVNEIQAWIDFKEAKAA